MREKIEFLGKTYNLLEKVADYKMEGGYHYEIFKTDIPSKTRLGTRLFVMLNNGKLRKITDAYSLWMYWNEPNRQQWIEDKDDKKLWEYARDIIKENKGEPENHW
jgi:hypothetical protein